MRRLRQRNSRFADVRSRLKLRRNPFPYICSREHLRVKVSTLKSARRELQSVLLSFSYSLAAELQHRRPLRIKKRLMQLPKQLKSVLIIKQTTHLLLWLCILAQQKLKPAEVLSKTYDIMPFGINTTPKHANTRRTPLTLMMHWRTYFRIQIFPLISIQLKAVKIPYSSI